jgi:hypothetical protein
MKTSIYHKRQYCSECNWWNPPVGGPGCYIFIWEGYPRSVCPKCGNEDIKDEIGQLISEEEIIKFWIFKSIYIKYIDFKVKN